MAPRAQGSDRLRGRSASCRVPSVPEPPPRLGARGATNLPGPVLLCVPRFSPRERRPQHAPRRSRLTRSSSPEAEAWAPPGLAPPLSRDLAHVTARRHLGLWPGHKSPGGGSRPFSRRAFPGRGARISRPRPGLAVLVSAWRGARVGPALLLCPAPRWTAAGTGEACSGGSTWRAAGLRPGLLGWWRSPAASSRRPAGRPAEAGPRPPLKGFPAAAQPLLSSHSQTALARGPRRHGRGSRVAGAAG